MKNTDVIIGIHEIKVTILMTLNLLCDMNFICHLNIFYSSNDDKDFYGIYKY